MITTGTFCSADWGEGLLSPWAMWSSGYKYHTCQATMKIKWLWWWQRTAVSLGGVRLYLEPQRLTGRSRQWRSQRCRVPPKPGEAPNTHMSLPTTWSNWTQRIMAWLCLLILVRTQPIYLAVIEDHVWMSSRLGHKVCVGAPRNVAGQMIGTLDEEETCPECLGSYSEDIPCSWGTSTRLLPSSP